MTPRRPPLAALVPLLFVLSLTTLPASAQSTGVSTTPAEDLIRRRRASSNHAISRHDTAGFAAILAENLFVVTSVSDRHSNKREYVESMAAVFASRPDVSYRRTPESVRVFAPWGMASESGRWVGSWTAADGRVVIGGAYFAKWRLKDGDWFVESETYVPEHCSGSVYCSTEP